MSYAEPPPFYASATQAMTNAGGPIALLGAPGATQAYRILHIWASLTRASPAGAHADVTWSTPGLGTIANMALFRDGDTHDRFDMSGPGFVLLPNDALNVGGILNVAGPSTGRFGVYYRIESST